MEHQTPQSPKLTCKSCNGSGRVGRVSKLGKDYDTGCRRCRGTGALELRLIASQTALMINSLRFVSPEFFAEPIAALEKCHGKLVEGYL